MMSEPSGERWGSLGDTRVGLGSRNGSGLAGKVQVVPGVLFSSTWACQSHAGTVTVFQVLYFAINFNFHINCY